MKLGEVLFVHTPAPPEETFYFFAPHFTPVPIPIGRKIRGLRDIVMLIKVTEDFPESPYFYWKLAKHVTKAEAQTRIRNFSRFGRHQEAQVLKDRFPGQALR